MPQFLAIFDKMPIKLILSGIRLFTIHLVCGGNWESSATCLMIPAFSRITWSWSTRAFSSYLTSYLWPLSTFEEVLSKIFDSSYLMRSRMDLISLKSEPIEKRSGKSSLTGCYSSFREINLFHYIAKQFVLLTKSSSLGFAKYGPSFLISWWDASIWSQAFMTPLNSFAKFPCIWCALSLKTSGCSFS